MSCHGNIMFEHPDGRIVTVGVDSQGNPEGLGRRIAQFLAGTRFAAGGWHRPGHSPECFLGMEDLVIRLITYLKGDPSVPGWMFLTCMNADYEYQIYKNQLGEPGVRVLVHPYGMGVPQTIFRGTGAEMVQWVDLMEGKTNASA